MTPKICDTAQSPKVANSTTSNASHKKLPSTTNAAVVLKTINNKRG